MKKIGMSDYFEITGYNLAMLINLKEVVGMQLCILIIKFSINGIIQAVFSAGNLDKGSDEFREQGY